MFYFKKINRIYFFDWILELQKLWAGSISPTHPFYSSLSTLCPQFLLLLTPCVSLVHLLKSRANIDTLLSTKVCSLCEGSLFVLYSSMGFDRWWMTFIYHYGVMQNNFTALKIPCVSLFILPLSLLKLLTATDLFTVSLVLAFLKSHRVGIGLPRWR